MFKNPLTPDVYNRRDVLGLKKFTDWTTENQITNLQHNRILQRGFMQRDPKDVMNDARLINAEWLTDICCPSIKAAITLHIAKELVVNYKVKETELNIIANQIYQSILNTGQMNIFNECKLKIENELNKMMQAKGELDEASIKKRATAMFEKNIYNRYDLVLMPKETSAKKNAFAKSSKKLKPFTLYMGESNGKLTYSFVDDKGKEFRDIVIDKQAPSPLTVEALLSLKRDILEITANVGHTLPLKPNPEQLAAASRLIIDKERKKLTDKYVSAQLKTYLSVYGESLGLEKKSMHTMGKTHDYSFLGAACSGKSTISRQYFNDDEKADYVVIATDNYRAFTLADTSEHEQKETKDIFTRTQDLAYMVKELVQEELVSTVKNNNARPNVICDCIILEPTMKDLLAQGEVTSVVAAYRGEPGYIGIAERADFRAKKTDAAPADKGRFVHTSELFKDHRKASQEFLSSLPNNAITQVYDTHVEQDTKPLLIAQVDTKNNIVEINNLRVMSEFLNKRHINVEAVNQIDLILSSQSNLTTSLVTNAENKAKSILDLIPKTHTKNQFFVKLKDKDGNIYSEIQANKEGKLILNIIDRNTFLKIGRSNTIEAAVLRAMTRQIKLGSLKDSHEAFLKYGDKISFDRLMDVNMRESRSYFPRK